jgi:hypothetical protein
VSSFCSKVTRKYFVLVVVTGNITHTIFYLVLES